MCTCASCVNTDKLSEAGFAEWPRGSIAGKRGSAADYAAHFRHSQQWGRGYNGEMHGAKEITAAPYSGPRGNPARIEIPGGTPISAKAYIAEFDRLNNLKPTRYGKAVTPYLVALARELRKAA